MKVMWKEQSCTAAIIVDQISKQSNWHFRTIKTLLRNLVNKKIIGFTVDEHDSRVYHYYPLIQEEEYLRQERGQFLDLYYDGNMSTLLVGFLKDKKVSKHEAKELRNLLNQSLDEELGDQE
ncbi:Methicillin resistance regulatory protein MecI [compost metagenome]